MTVPLLLLLLCLVCYLLSTQPNPDPEPSKHGTISPQTQAHPKARPERVFPVFSSVKASCCRPCSRFCAVCVPPRLSSFLAATAAIFLSCGSARQGCQQETLRSCASEICIPGVSLVYLGKNAHIQLYIALFANPITNTRNKSILIKAQTGQMNNPPELYMRLLLCLRWLCQNMRLLLCLHWLCLMKCVYHCQQGGVVPHEPLFHFASNDV